jgi:hypothetical protein
MAQSSMPNPHYHLCRYAATTCDFNCKLCGRLTREMPRLGAAHFAYGCCHRCAEYRGCDFVERHRKVMEGAVTGDLQRAPAEYKDGQPAMPAAMSPQNSETSPPPA